MTSTKAEPGPFDAFDKARPDEPIFVLLGRDECAPGAITEWCRLRRNRALKQHDHSSDAVAAELRQCAEAEAIAFAMEDYRQGQAVAATEGSRAPANYSGVRGENVEDRERRRQTAVAVAHLREAAFHAGEARDKLTAIGALEETDGAVLVAALDGINLVADHHTPKRPGVQQALPLAEPVA